MTINQTTEDILAQLNLAGPLLQDTYVEQVEGLGRDGVKFLDAMDEALARGFSPERWKKLYKLKGGLEQDADDLRIATVHWLRHTGISEDVKHRPHEHERDDAGHASMATTDRYIESDLRERHESGRNKRVREI